MDDGGPYKMKNNFKPSFRRRSLKIGDKVKVINSAKEFTIAQVNFNSGKHVYSDSGGLNWFKEADLIKVVVST